MSAPRYLLVSAQSAPLLAAEVNRTMQRAGWTCLGAPLIDPEGGVYGRWVQAMIYDPSVPAYPISDEPFPPVRPL